MTSHRISDADVEAVLAGRRPADAELGVLSDVVGGIRRAYVTELDDAHVVGLSGRLAAVAAAAPLDGGPVGASRAGSRSRRRGVIALVAAGLMAGAFGTAAAADEAAPGDFLYGLDRALEVVGINDGGAHERLVEVQALLAHDDVEQALDTSLEAVDDMDGMDAADAEELTGLLHAAESVLAEGSEQSQERREQVAAMLTFMTQTELQGKEFGQAVSQQARGIVEEPTESGEAAASGDVDVESTEESTDETGAVDDGPGNAGSSNSSSGSNGSSDSSSNAGGSSDKDSSSDGSANSSNGSANSGAGVNENANPNATSESRGNASDKGNSSAKD